jgi:hypothetical protein
MTGAGGSHSCRQWAAVRSNRCSIVNSHGRCEDPVYGARFPWENGYNESFNETLRDELLNVELVDTLHKAKVLLSDGNDTITPSIRKHSWATSHQLP